MPDMLDGRLSLTTPEGVRLLLTPAGPATRAWAWAIDLLLWLAAMWATYVLLAHSKVGNGVTGLLMFLTYWGYPVIGEVYFRGRTVGKQVLGIEVRRADGLPVGWRESALRNLLLVADFMPLFYLSGLLCMLYDGHMRRIGDLVAGTQVVYRERAPARPVARLAEPLPLPFPLTPAQQRTLIDLLERETQLAPERVAELGTLAGALTGLEGAASVERLRAYAAGLAR